MVENILILGNGFDLAMGRKTSYGDFLRFLNSISFLFYCQQVYNQQIDIKNYVFPLKEFEKILEDSESNHGEDFQNELEFYILIHDDKVKLGILLDFLSNYFENKKPLRALSEDNRNFQDFNNLMHGSFRRDLLLYIRKIYEGLDKQSVISKYLLDVEIIDDLIQKTGKEYKWLLKIRDNLFLKYINENKDKLGKKWSSIELVISDIAEAIVYIRDYSKKGDTKFGRDFFRTLRKQSVSESNFMAIKYVSDNIDKFVPEYLHILNDSGVQKAMDVCNEKFIQSLEELTDYLEFYLTYLDKLDFDSEQRIVKQDSSLDAIEGLEKAKVLTFNYTDTANRLFGIPEESTHFIHGRIDFARDKKSINTMVFGIEDKEDKEDKTENINPDLISYQKFYQRIIKETGSDYRKFFEKPKDSGKSVDDMNIIVFGHSVDPLDKEIFKKCFKLAEERGGKYKFIFNYYDEEAKREIVKNLTIILGKEKMISLTAEQKVAFVKCDDVEKMRKELIKLKKWKSKLKTHQKTFMKLSFF